VNHSNNLLQFKHINQYIVCELNVRGVNDSAKRNLIDRWAHKHFVDFLCCSETKVNSNCCMKSEHYTWYFSTGVDIKDKKHCENMKFENQRIDTELRLKVTELHGVCIAYQKQIIAFDQAGCSG